MKKSIFSVLALLMCHNAYTQSFTIINRSPIDLTYKITASLELCDRYCMHNDKIKANSTAVWASVDSLYWLCEGKPNHFSSFSLNNGKEIGNCWENRTSHTIKNVASNITYTWKTDGQTKNITVILEPAPISTGK